MKVLAIMGSPRKRGNGFKVIKRIEERLEAQQVDFEYYYLKDAGLKMCRGCFKCILKGEQRCPIKDGRKELESMILDADGVIVYSPVYGLNVSGLTKVFIDRFCYAGHHPRFFRQKTLFVATTCGMGLDGAFRALAYLEDWGFHVVGRLGVECPHYALGERKTKKQDRAIDQAADDLLAAMSSSRPPTPSFHQIFQYNIMKTLHNVRPDMKEKFPGDYQYWAERGWLEPSTRFFYDTEHHLQHKVYALMVRAFTRVAAPHMG